MQSEFAPALKRRAIFGRLFETFKSALGLKQSHLTKTFSLKTPNPLGHRTRAN